MKPLKSLKTKILLGFTVVGLLVVCISIWSIWHILRIQQVSTLAVTEHLHNAEASGRMRTALHDHHRAVMLYIGGGRAEALDIMTIAEESFYRAYNEAAGNVAQGANTGSLLRIGEGFRRFDTEVRRLIAVAGRDSVNGGRHDSTLFAHYLAGVAPLHDRVARHIFQYRDESYRLASNEMGRVQTMTRFAGYSTGLIAVIVLIATIVAGRNVARIVLKPIDHLTGSVQRIAGGDFRQRVEIRGGGVELELLTAHFNAMAQRLQEYDAIKVEQVMEEKQRSEQIIRDLTDVVVVCDEAGRVIYFNRQAELVTGISWRLAKDRRLADLAGEHPLLGRMSNDLARGAAPPVEETVTSVVDGAEHTYRYELATLHNETVETIGHLFRLHDVTRFKQMDTLRSKMISTVSHELRTPLTSIGMSLELLLETGEVEGRDPLERQLLTNIQEDVRRLQIFVNDLLDLSRIEQGRQLFHPEAAAPRGMVEEAITSVLPLTAGQSIRIDSTGVAADLPLVHADPNKIAQVFRNLFSNAIRYTPFNGTIVVDAALDGEYLRFAVRDHGPGISPEEAEHVFDRFYQIRDDQRAQGSGLGLAIVKEVVEAHGGRVWVESAVGQGSSFYFTLPRYTEGRVETGELDGSGRI